MNTRTAFHHPLGLLDHPLNLRFSPKRLTVELMSHFVVARLGADSNQPIKIEAVSRKLLFLGGGVELA